MTGRRRTLDKPCTARLYTWLRNLLSRLGCYDDERITW